MPTDEQITAQEHNQPTAAQQQSAKQARSRQSDEGPEILPCMEHFVTLVRKAKRPGLALLLVERASATSLPEVAALTDAAKGILAVQSRKAMFHAVAKFGLDVQQHIERAAERVVLLDDEYGAQAVQSLLDDEDVNDAAIMAAPSDRYSRALFLCLLQDFPETGAKRDQRFDNAERVQVMHRQWKSENYSSHYLGPKGVMPSIDADVEGVLRGRISALFPQVASDQILIEQFTRREPWLSRALVKLNELDQYDDAELVRKKTAAMFAGFVTRQNPEDNLMGEGAADGDGIALAGLEPGTLQILEPGEDIKFSDPADVGGSYGEFLRTQFRAVAAAIGVTYEQLTGDLTGVNYSSIRAGMLEFRRRCEMVQHGVLVHQMCRPVWAAWMKQAVLAGAIDAPGFARGGPARRQYSQVKWIPQGWQWVDPEKEFKAMLLAIRAGLMSRSEAIAAFGYDAEDVDREIAADNLRADDLGLIFDSDPRRTSKDGGSAEPNKNAADTTQSGSSSSA